MWPRIKDRRLKFSETATRPAAILLSLFMAEKILEASAYNSLLYVDTADQHFPIPVRDEIFAKLITVLQQYGNNRFGVCLIHRHCSLEEGERMVSDGDISQPQRDAPAYPERWLATGESYEFSREKTTSPSEELLERFRTVIGDIKVLGLCYIRDEETEGILRVERTEGRSNITAIVPSNAAPNAITTAWHPLRPSKAQNQTLGQPIAPALACVVVCIKSTKTAVHVSAGHQN